MPGLELGLELRLGLELDGEIGQSQRQVREPLQANGTEIRHAAILISWVATHDGNG